MKSSTYTLIPNTTFGTVAENYDGSSTSFAGVPVKASSYYLRNKSIQTISWYVSALEAKVYIEGTLESDSDTENWVSLYTIHEDGSILTENNVTDIEGNFTWIRIKITDFSAGEIIKIVMSY